MKYSVKIGVSFLVLLGVGVIGPSQAGDQPGVTEVDGVTILDTSKVSTGALTPQEMADAQAWPLPTIDTPPTTLADHLLSGESGRQLNPGFEPGSPGSGEELANEPLPPSSQLSQDDAEVDPNAYGSSLHPYTTMRVNAFKNLPARFYPFRAAGKLYFKIGSSTYVCSGSLIKAGVVVTAAHCVCEYGSGNFYSDWEFVPAQYQGNTPYGTWTAKSVSVRASYIQGTEPCISGVVCENDVAILVLREKGPPGSKFYAGDKIGWLGYGWDGYGFTPDGLTLVNQLGYPSSHDSGLIMQRTDSQGFVDASLYDNTVWGGRQTSGSSGGPEIVNLGIRGQLTTPLGSDEQPNTVIGVTSWGYTDANVKQQGASPFTSTNVVPLVSGACSNYPDACD